MLNRIHICTVLCMAVSTGLYAVNAAGADEMSGSTSGIPSAVSPSRQTEADVSLPAGIQSKNLNSDKGIENAVKAIHNDALIKNGLDNLVNRLVDQDRVRINKSLPSGTSLNNIDGNKNQKLNELAASIETNWKAKYNTGFDFDINKVFTNDFIHVQTGEVTDPNQLIGKWPVPASTRMQSGGAGASGSTSGSGMSGSANVGGAGVSGSVGSSGASGSAGTGGMAGGTSGTVTPTDAKEAQNRAFGGEVNLEKGRNVAIAHFMGVQGYGGLNVSLIHEAGGWKIDIPNDISAQNLYDNLCKNLSYIDQQKDKWPADSATAYRQLTLAVVAALYDITPTGEMQKNQGVRPSGSTGGSGMDTGTGGSTGGSTGSPR